jgi:hypothetical protein
MDLPYSAATGLARTTCGAMLPEIRTCSVARRAGGRGRWPCSMPSGQGGVSCRGTSGATTVSS